MTKSYLDRLRDGDYDTVTDLFSSESEALANLNFGEGFTAETVAWNDNPFNFTTRFIRSGTKRTELVVNLFSELRGPEHGTSISCLGPRYKPNENVKDIIAGSIKDEIVIGLPTNASEELARLSENQTIALNQVYFGQLPNIHIEGVNKKGWLRANPNCNNIVVTMPAKYKVVQNSGKGRMTKKRAHGEMDDDQVKVEAGAFYDPALLPDYDPIVCQFQQAKLVQHDLFDIHGELIAPWNTANALRKGVVVAIEARLLVYHFTENNPTSKYQLQARTIRTLIESPEPKVTVAPARKMQPPLETPSPSKMFLKLAKGGEAATPAKASGSGKRAKKA